MVYENIRIIAQCVVCPSIIVSWRGLAELLISRDGNAKAWAWDKRKSTDSHVFFIVLPIWGAYRPNSLLIMKGNKKEEIQSRREFFKSAAKKALPILGAIALTQLPFVAKSHESQITQDCSYGCAGSCWGGCTSTCGGNCLTSCQGNCSGDCMGSCKTGCDGSCSRLCSWSSY